MLLNETQLDICKELINIGVGRAAAMLNEMLNSKIKLEVPHIQVSNCNEVAARFNDKNYTMVSSIELEFTGRISGTIKLILQPNDASDLVSLLTGEEKGSYELDAVRVGTLNEVGNIILNSILGSIGNLITTNFDFSLPNYQEDHLDNLLCINKSSKKTIVLLSHAHFEVENISVGGDVLFLLGEDSFNELKNDLDKVGNQ